MTEIIICISVVCIMIVLVMRARHNEKKEYNNGICPKCGGKFELFDYDSQGGRGYCCDKCGHKTWVSYNVDKIRR